MYDDVRKIMPPIVEDQPRYKDIQRVRQYLLELNATFIWRSVKGFMFKVSSSKLWIVFKFNMRTIDAKHLNPHAHVLE